MFLSGGRQSQFELNITLEISNEENALLRPPPLQIHTVYKFSFDYVILLNVFLEY